MNTDVETKPVHVNTDTGDHDRFAHYVSKAKLADATILGHEITALCGKRWVPFRDPDRFPMCPDCEAIYASLPSNSS